MSTMKSVVCGYDVVEGMPVVVHHHVESNFNSCRPVDELPTQKENSEYNSGPSYSSNNDTTYYIGCGIVTKTFNKTCWIKLEY